MKNKTLALLLGIAAIIASVGILIFAIGSLKSNAYGTCGENLTWTLNNGTLTISGKGAMKDYERGVTDTPWEPYLKSIKKVIISEGVTSIGVCSFPSNVKEVSIPNSVTTIGEGAFGSCERLKSIHIPNGVTSIGEYAFAWCEKLKSVTLPITVTKIGRSAFTYCESLISITIPASVTSIEKYAFNKCPNLTVYTASSVDLSETGIPADRIIKITPEEAMERYLKDNPDQEEYVRQYEQEQQLKAQQQQRNQQQQKQKKAKSTGHLKFWGKEIKGKRSDCKDNILRALIAVPVNENDKGKFSTFQTTPQFGEPDYTLCLIEVLGTPKTDQVYCLYESIAFSRSGIIHSWADIKKVYLDRKESLIKIYGKPKYEEEYFESPYSETNNPLKAIDEEKIHYRTEIYTNNGRIVHTIINDETSMNSRQIVTAYIDAAGERLYEQEQ